MWEEVAKTAPAGIRQRRLMLHKARKQVEQVEVRAVLEHIAL